MDQQVIVARRGERIVLAQYPPRFIDTVNERLDRIVAERDVEVTEACS